VLKQLSESALLNMYHFRRRWAK